MTESTHDDASVSDNQDTVSKEPLLLLCTENAIRLFSLSHSIQVFIFLIYHFFSLNVSFFCSLVSSSIQGTKKIINKKKFSGTCCFASLIRISSEIGLALVYSNGEIEIR